MAGGFNNDDVQVRFGGDATGLHPAAESAKRDINEVGKAAGGLTTVFRGLLNISRNSFGGAMFAGVKEHIHEVTVEAREAGVEALGMKEIFGMAFGGIAAALSVPALLEFGEHMGDLVEKTGQQAQRLGMSATAITQWGAVMKMANMDTNVFVSAVQRLERSTVMAASGSKVQSAAFRALGIDARSATDPQKMLLEIADKFQDMPDGPRKTALAMQLLGRSGAQLIPILNQGADGIREQMKTAEEYGAVMDEQLIQKGERVAEAFDEQQLGVQGVKNVMFDEFAPTIATVVENMNDMIKSFVESYREGGAVAVIFGTIKVALNGVITDIMVLKLGFSELWDVAQIVLGSLIGAVWTFGQAIWDALHGRFQKAKDDFKGGMQDIANFVKDKAKEIVEAQDKTFAGIDKLWKGTDGKKRKPRAEGGGGDNDIEGLGGGHSESMVSQWEAQLQRKLMAEKNYFADSKAEELAFWQQKLALTANGSKDQASVQSKIYQLSKSIAQDQYRSDMETFDYKKQLAKNDYDTQIALENEKLAEVKRLYGEDSAEFTKVLREKETMERQRQQELLQIERQRVQQQSQIEESAVNSTKAILATDAQMRMDHIDALNNLGKLSDAKALAQKQQVEQQQQQDEQRFEDRIFQIKADALRQQLALQNLEPAARRDLNAQLEQLEQQHANTTREINARSNALMVRQADQSAQQVEQHWASRIEPIGGAFNNAFQSIFMRTKTVGQAIKGIFVDLGQSMIGSISKAAAKWIAHTLAMSAIHKAEAASQVAVDTTAATTKTATQAMSGVMQVLSNAAVAASGAYAATAMIPIVGPELAPAAAASAYAATASFAPLASASGGYDIPSGINPLTQLHQEEMVLPAHLANPIRDMVKMASAGGNRLASASYSAGAAARAGLTQNTSSPTFNYQPQHTNNVGGLEEMLERDGATMRKWFRNQVRNGSLGVPSGNKR